MWINNAGLSAGMRFFDELSEEEIKEVVDVNIVGVMQASLIIIPYFIRKGKGILINMGGLGSKGEKSPHLTSYAVTKAAVASFTKNLAEEYKKYPISWKRHRENLFNIAWYKINEGHWINDLVSNNR